MKDYAIGEVMSDVDSLAHYGKKGMKWGVRGSKSVTGVSRGKGALKDRNSRDIARFQGLKSALDNGGGTRGQKAINITNRMTMGKKLTGKFYSVKLSTMKSQNTRIDKGKTNISDKMSAAMVNPVGRIVSATPGN